MRTAIGVLAAILLAAPAFAQTEGWNGLADRFQVDAGYFHLNATTKLRFDGPPGDPGEVDFEHDLGLPATVDTFWVDARWRVGRRHQLQLGFTRLSRDRTRQTLSRDFTWGGETFNAGLSATSTASSDILLGYYRFAIYRNARFEIGPALGVGYLWVSADIEATGTVAGPGGGTVSRSLDEGISTGSLTGAIGGYVEAWPAKRLLVRGDYLYIKVKPERSDASVNDWRVAANYYFTRNFGVGAQYKYNKYTYGRGVLQNSLGGELTFDGGQAYLTSRF